MVIPTSGETPEEIATATCIMIPNVILAGDLNIYRNTQVDGRIISYIINHIINRKISRIAQGKSVVHVKADELAKIQINYPSGKEQQKLIDFLGLLSDQIEKQQKLVDSLKLYKRGALQRIFENNASDKGWQIFKLKEIFKKVTHRNKNGMVNNVITNSAEYGLVPQRDFFDKDIAVEGNTDNYFVIEKGNFVYNPRKSKSAPYGPFNRYEFDDKGIISPLYTCFVLFLDINPTYLSWYFKSNAWHRYIYDNGSQGVRHDRVSMSDDLLMGIPILIPDEATQSRIAKALDLLESSITESERILQLLQIKKYSLLKEMFI